jgi:DNA-binding NtrC family response regulator
MSAAEPRATVLVVDDEPGICTALDRYLESEGHRSLTAASAEEALRLLEDNRPDVALVDFRLPGMDGLTLLRRMRDLRPSMEIVLITAFGGVDTAIRATQEGAYAYLPKPLDLDEVGRLVQRMVTRAPVAVSSSTEPDDEPLELVLHGPSPAARGLAEQLARCAERSAPVLLVGEVGSGREATARALLGRVAGRGQLRVLHCGARPTVDLERQLEDLADHPDDLPYLSELGELSGPEAETILAAGARMSSRLRLAASLQVRDDSEPAARLIDRATELGWTTLEIPALRERSEDLPELVARLLARVNAEVERPVRGIDDAALGRLEAHDWPGNLRELENVIRTAALSTRGDVLTADALGLAPRAGTPEGPNG